ncbi:nucleotidyltransferase, partial [Devosia psychrophila]
MMALNNTQLRYYDSNILRLPADKRKEYHAQVDRLIDELCKSVRNKTEIKITNIVKAAPFAKYTILRNTAFDPVEVEGVRYSSGRDAAKVTHFRLRGTSCGLLRE